MQILYIILSKYILSKLFAYRDIFDAFFVIPADFFKIKFFDKSEEYHQSDILSGLIQNVCKFYQQKSLVVGLI